MCDKDVGDRGVNAEGERSPALAEEAEEEGFVGLFLG